MESAVATRTRAGHDAVHALRVDKLGIYTIARQLIFDAGRTALPQLVTFANGLPNDRDAVVLWPRHPLELVQVGRHRKPIC